MYCGDPHPSLPDVTCRAEKDSYHPEHAAMVAGVREAWLNPACPPVRHHDPSEIKRMARRARHDRRVGAPPSPEELARPHAWLRSDARPTERHAAEISAVRNSRRRRQVLIAIVRSGERGATYDEIAEFWRDPVMPAPRVASRGGELEESGWIEPLYVNDRPAVRETVAGGEAIVWVLTDDARQLVGSWLYEDIEMPGSTLVDFG